MKATRAWAILHGGGEVVSFAPDRAKNEQRALAVYATRKTALAYKLLGAGERVVPVLVIVEKRRKTAKRKRAL